MSFLESTREEKEFAASGSWRLSNWVISWLIAVRRFRKRVSPLRLWRRVSDLHHHSRQRRFPPEPYILYSEIDIPSAFNFHTCTGRPTLLLSEIPSTSSSAAILTSCCRAASSVTPRAAPSSADVCGPRLFS